MRNIAPSRSSSKGLSDSSREKNISRTVVITTHCTGTGISLSGKNITLTGSRLKACSAEAHFGLMGQIGLVFPCVSGSTELASGCGETSDLITSMQSHNTAGHIVVFDQIETRSANQFGKALLIRETADRLDQILIGFAIARHLFTNQRDDIK